MTRTRFRARPRADRPDGADHVPARAGCTSVFVARADRAAASAVVWSSSSPAALLFAQYWFSDRIALYRDARPDRHPGAGAASCTASIDRLCALADMPKPRVAIADTDLPNAFATGRNPKRAVVCVTTGLLRRLDADELEGVLAHELSHVAHRDVAVMTIASFLGVLAGLITRFAPVLAALRRPRPAGPATTALVDR